MGDVRFGIGANGALVNADPPRKGRAGLLQTGLLDAQHQPQGHLAIRVEGVVMERGGLAADGALDPLALEPDQDPLSVPRNVMDDDRLRPVADQVFALARRIPAPRRPRDALEDDQNLVLADVLKALLLVSAASSAAE